MAKQTFESAMKELESIVEELEDKELTLDQALKKFQQGMKLSRFCSKKLDESERKVSQLIEEDDGTVREEPISADTVVDEHQ
jgi:exodeoxyribonuclease VII small subunit